MKKITLSLLLVGTLLQAQDNIGVTAKFGTLGFGLDVTKNITSDINLRANINKGSLNLDATDSEVIEDGSFELESAGILVDYYPFKNGFRFSSGLYYGNNQVDVSSIEEENNILIGSHHYDLTKDTKTHVSIDMSGVAPYVGLGWGNTILSSSKWSFNVDVGVLYQGSVKTSFNMSGTAIEHNSGETINLSTNQQFLKDARDEKLSIKQDTEGLEWYPVVSIGVAYRF